MRVRTTDNARAVEVLKGLDWVTGVEVDGDSLLVAAASDRSPEISTTLGKAEVYVTEMAAEETSLEQYFLDVTEEERESRPAPNFNAALNLPPSALLIE